jgi:putative peptidoglycan lipid II flippase
VSTAPDGPSPARQGRDATLLKAVGVGLVALGLTVLAKGLAFGRDVALSVVFGADAATDAFFIANMIPGILWAAFLATINVVVLPMYVEKRSQAPAVAGHFANEAIQTYLAVSLVMGLVCVAFAGPIVRLTAPGASSETLALATQLTIIMAVGFPFSGYVAIQNSLQQAHGRFIGPLAVPVVNNIIAILGILAAAVMADIRVAVVAAVGAWLLQAPFQRFQNRSLYPTVRRVILSKDNVHRIVLLSLPVMFGTFLDQINIFVGINLAGSVGEGAISQLNYASRLAMFVATAFSMLVAYFFFPRIAASASAGDDAGAGHSLTIGLLLTVALTLPLTVVAYVMRQDVVALVYGHGGLSPRDLSGTAMAFAAYALGIVLIAAREMLNRLFFSYQRMLPPLLLGVLASVVNFFVSSQLVDRLGVVGIALGASVGALVYVIGQIALVLVWKPRLIRFHLVVGLAWLGLSSVPGWFALQAVARHTEEMVPLFRLVSGTLAFGLPFMMIAAIAAWRMGLLRQIRRTSAT